MNTIIETFESPVSPEGLVASLRDCARTTLLRSGQFDREQGRYSFVVTEPFLRFRSFGPRCELEADGRRWTQFGNPWHLLDALMSRCELLDEVDLPFPLGGCFGYWGYDLKNFVEPRLRRRSVTDLEWPDCQVGFYDGVVVFDHALGRVTIISTGLRADGSRDAVVARARTEFWRDHLRSAEACPPEPPGWSHTSAATITSSVSEADFLKAVRRAQEYIRVGDIYQVNLSQRLTADWSGSGWDFFQSLREASPAPFAAYLDGGDFQIASSSPELFLRLSGAQIRTRPIKGTRPRADDPDRDTQLTYELQTSVKEMAELVMITDLLRNDLGRVCAYGSIRVPELARLERFAQVQHLVSTVEGRLREGVTHFAAFASCFPGGSVTGAPKFRAMEVIDELEPVARGPYTGAIGYLGFNRESQLSVTIRAGFVRDRRVHFHVGAGIVADSQPEAEYAETLVKARGFTRALERVVRNEHAPLSAPGLP